MMRKGRGYTEDAMVERHSNMACNSGSAALDIRQWNMQTLLHFWFLNYQRSTELTQEISGHFHNKHFMEINKEEQILQFILHTDQ